MFTYDEAGESLDVLLHDSQVCLHPLLLEGLPLDILDVPVDGVHNAVLRTALLIKLDAQVQEDELKDILLVFWQQMF